jgi:hypothetical protein
MGQAVAQRNPMIVLGGATQSLHTGLLHSTTLVVGTGSDC